MSDGVIESERTHLALSRQALRRMYDEVADWETATAGDHVSTQYLRQALYRRKQSLVDYPDVPLFFGRLVYDTALGADLDEDIHIGRRHVSAEPGADPLVTDWRAPLAQAFYQASSVDPRGVRLRRRFGFAKGEITAHEDEDLSVGQHNESDILRQEIERPRSGPMRDIVATIQPDQDLLVRTDLERSLCIQGAPGTGKTAVGLHRAAYLLYAHREQLTRQGVIVVGPNASFLDYIGDVLPTLGEIDAASHTVTSLLTEATGVRLRAEEPSDVATLKGDTRLAEVIARAIWASINYPTEQLQVSTGVRTWRVHPHQLAEAIDGLRARGVRYEAGRAMLPQSLAHRVLVRMEEAGESPDDRTQAAVARSAPVKALAKQLWPALTAPKLVHRLLSDPEFLALCADGVLSPEEQHLLLWTKPAKSAGSARWSLADVVLIDEADDALNRIGSVGHVIIDEAQDLSAMMLRALGRRASTGSVTLLGDLAQATTPWASTTWDEALAHLGKPEATVTELVEGFRVPPDVIEYAARLLPTVAPGLTPPRSVRHQRGNMRFVSTNVDVATEVATLANREGTVGVIVADADVASTAQQLTSIPHNIIGQPRAVDSHVELVPASLAKGLEFDHVCLLDPRQIVAGEPDRVTGLRRLYVCLTRAVTSLVICGSVPDELGAST